jgi:hypothetical protein
MTTATRTTPKAATTLPRRTLPALQKDRAPLGIESLGEPWATLVPAQRERFAEAVKLRSAHEDAEREIEQAAARDREAFKQAAIEDKPDPGRRHELKAVAEAEAAYTAALTATDLSNQANRDVAAAVRGEPGEQLAREIGNRIDDARARLAEHLDPVAGDLGEMAALAAIGEAVEQTRKHDHGQMAGGRSANVTDLAPLYLHGNPIAPALVVELLRDYDPRKGRSDA